MPKIEKIMKKARQVGLILLSTAGLFLIAFVGIALTDWPWFARDRLARPHTTFTHEPHTIVLMGAGGFPSGPVLMRTWFTSQLAIQYPKAKIVIATPGDTLAAESTAQAIKKNLVERGVSSERICIEPNGLNTRHQALMSWTMHCNNEISDNLVIITSPEHTYRSVRAFEKVGFQHVGAFPTFESELELSLITKFDKLNKPNYTPDVGQSVAIRYKFWNYMKYEIDVFREYAAIAYYKLNKWI
jgi:uncharacterized SAM-binding protein YcdF (DUF218 family)